MCIQGCNVETRNLRPITKMEILAIHMLQYKCSQPNEQCTGKVFTHEEYVEHMKDHAKGVLPSKCPIGC